MTESQMADEEFYTVINNVMDRLEALDGQLTKAGFKIWNGLMDRADHHFLTHPSFIQEIVDRPGWSSSKEVTYEILIAVRCRCHQLYSMLKVTIKIIRNYL